MKKKSKKESSIDFGSYSDLFMVMSFVFLFMYVVSSINTGITIIQERHKADKEKQKLANTVEKYERKIETDLSDEQKKEYEKLKDGLVKLKEDAAKTREYQEQMVKAAREKEKELETYQDTIKTMMVEQIKVNEKIKEKDEMISKVKNDASEVIQNQERAIASLKENVDAKTLEINKKVDEIKRREAEIKNIEIRVQDLQKKEVLAETQAKELSELNRSLQEKEATLSKIKESEATLAKEKSELYKASIIQVNRLNKEKEKIVQATQEEIQKINQEKNNLKKKTEEELSRLESENASIAQEKDRELKRLKEQKQAELESLINSKEAEKSALLAQKDSELKGLQDKYLKATEGLRKEIAKSLTTDLRKSGLNASVNTSTGDVTIHFKNAYFDYNSSILKDPMKEELKAFIPQYARSLFNNKKYAQAISNIEIIGSSSPSFKGKYVNPRAIASSDDKKAMTYNLDLSYRRAKSIFDYTFLGQELAFEYKEQMIPLIKVTGTGYLQAMDELVLLPESEQNKKKGFCGLYNCDLFQKVTLRFNLKDKVSQK